MSTIVGCCTSLRSLTIKDDGFMVRSSYEERSILNDIFDDYSSLIDSVRGTLEDLTIRTNGSNEQRWLRGPTRHKVHIEPVLCKGPWPMLKSLSMRTEDVNNGFDGKPWVEYFLQMVGPRDIPQPLVDYVPCSLSSH